ncbi:MAG TPA: hypothetical protein VGH27_18100 [Streptosporangiaceae bacterium]|jgi:hypothetical protein
MNRTEARLTDALADSYTRLQQRTLTPLTAPPPRRHRRVRWLAPVAAAAAVALVAAGATTLMGHLHTGPHTAHPGASSAGPSAPPSSGLPTAYPVGPAGPAPRYYVDMTYDGQVAVRDTGTGAMTATVPVPHVRSSGDGVIATGPGGVFYVAAFATQTQEQLYRFKVTGTGQVSGFSLVKGMTFGLGGAEEMAVSPDGSRLAVAVGGGSMGNDASITVVTLGNGTRQVWQGGLARPGYRTFDISGLSWSSGTQLVFSAQWCQVDEVNNQVCGSAVHGDRRMSAVRSLDVTGSGGQLSDGRLLFGQSAQYPYIATAVTSPGSALITAVVLSGPVRNPKSNTVPSQLSVLPFESSISSPTDVPGFVLYQRPTGPTFAWVLSPSWMVGEHINTQHWLLEAADAYDGDGPPSEQNQGYNGWVSSGQLVLLRPADGQLASEAW